MLEAQQTGANDKCAGPENCNNCAQKIGPHCGQDAGTGAGQCAGQGKGNIAGRCQNDKVINM